MGFLDSTSATVDAILTRKGRELLARNDGSFKITKFAFGDDEVNYQLYNLLTDDDSSILNLPIMEPSSNEDVALRYRLITLPKGSVQVATLTVAPSNITIGTGYGLAEQAPVSMTTQGGTDTSYTLTSRNAKIADIVQNQPQTNVNGFTFATIIAVGNGTTIIDIVGNDTGAIGILAVTVVGEGK